MAKQKKKPGVPGTLRPTRATFMRKEDVIDALNKIGVHANCPVCQANAWGGIGPGRTEGTEVAVHLQAVGPDGLITPGAGIECAALVCTKCGYVRLHAVEALQRA